MGTPATLNSFSCKVKYLCRWFFQVYRSSNSHSQHSEKWGTFFQWILRPQQILWTTMFRYLSNMLASNMVEGESRLRLPCPSYCVGTILPNTSVEAFHSWFRGTDGSRAKDHLFQCNAQHYYFSTFCVRKKRLWTSRIHPDEDTHLHNRFYNTTYSHLNYYWFVFIRQYHVDPGSIEQTYKVQNSKPLGQQ
jgi:hypothetical protein